MNPRELSIYLSICEKIIIIIFEEKTNEIDLLAPEDMPVRTLWYKALIFYAVTFLRSTIALI